MNMPQITEAKCCEICKYWKPWPAEDHILGERMGDCKNHQGYEVSQYDTCDLWETVYSTEKE